MLPDECNPGSVDIVRVTGSGLFDSSDVLDSILRPAELEMNMYVLFGKLMECIECMVTTGWRGVAEEQWHPRDLSILPHLDSSTYVLYPLGINGDDFQSTYNSLFFMCFTLDHLQ
jgi:hypothetical protein